MTPTIAESLFSAYVLGFGIACGLFSLCLGFVLGYGARDGEIRRSYRFRWGR